MIIKVIQVGELGVNCYIASCPETKECLVIDPGAEVEMIFKYIESEALIVKAIINTHGHADHIGANAELKKLTNAPILIGTFDQEMLLEPKLNLSVYIEKPIISAGADTLLNDGDIISFGKEKLTVLHTPGHTRGGICLLGTEVVFTGDTLFNQSIGRTDFPGGSMTDIISSIKTKLMCLNDDVKVLPGHGPASLIGLERQKNPFLN